MSKGFLKNLRTLRGSNSSPDIWEGNEQPPTGQPVASASRRFRPASTSGDVDEEIFVRVKTLEQLEPSLKKLTKTGKEVQSSAEEYQKALRSFYFWLSRYNEALGKWSATRQNLGCLFVDDIALDALITASPSLPLTFDRPIASSPQGLPPLRGKALPPVPQSQSGSPRSGASGIVMGPPISKPLPLPPRADSDPQLFSNANAPLGSPKGPAPRPPTRPLSVTLTRSASAVIAAPQTPPARVAPPSRPRPNPAQPGPPTSPKPLQKSESFDSRGLQESPRSQAGSPQAPFVPARRRDVMRTSVLVIGSPNASPTDSPSASPNPSPPSPTAHSPLSSALESQSLSHLPSPSAPSTRILGRIGQPAQSSWVSPMSPPQSPSSSSAPPSPFSSSPSSSSSSSSAPAFVPNSTGVYDKDIAAAVEAFSLLQQEIVELNIQLMTDETQKVHTPLFEIIKDYVRNVQILKDDLNAIKTEISSITKKLQKERAKLDVEGQPCDILKMFAYEKELLVLRPRYANMRKKLLALLSGETQSLSIFMMIASQNQMFETYFTNTNQKLKQFLPHLQLLTSIRSTYQREIRARQEKERSKDMKPSDLDRSMPLIDLIMEPKESLVLAAFAVMERISSVTTKQEIVGRLRMLFKASGRTPPLTLLQHSQTISWPSTEYVSVEEWLKAGNLTQFQFFLRANYEAICAELKLRNAGEEIFQLSAALTAFDSY